MNILQRMKDYRAVTSRRKRYVTRFKQTLERLGIPNKPVGGEDDYIRFWSRLSNHVEPYSFRLYSRYLEWDGKGNIIPEDIAHSYIEPYLNPIKFRGYYTDKNMYAQYLQPASAFPKTLLCRVAGSVLMDGSFKPILSFVADSMTFYDYLKEYERVVIKPSVNSKGGAGVMLFEKANGFFAHDDGTVVLDGCFLQQYGNDFVVQEVVSQHPYLAQFNPSSLNSIRVCMYRSVVTETVKMAAAAIRIGKSGSFVDNTHSGGGLVVVDPETGKLGTTAYNWEGISIDTLNGVDFRQEEYVIPYWERIRDFAISIASQNHHCRLIALDLTLDKDNVPRMIEYNVNAFSYRIPMLGGRSLFGDETQDVIDYCKRMQKDMDKISVLWTGGLDSTYLVAKLLRWGGVIQPYYIVDEGRKSVKKELRAISRISVELRKWPMVRGVLLDTIVVEKKDIRQYPDITEAWKHLHQKYNLGSQYDWLARFARQERLKLMVGVQMDPRGRVVHTLGGKQLPLEEVKEGIEAFTIAGIEDIDADAKLLYSDLLFPRLVVGVAKVQEWQELSDMGLEKVAKMTWFCHRPVFGLPCGHCNPCKDVLHEGLAFRVPLLGHIMGWGRSWIGRIIHRES